MLHNCLSIYLGIGQHLLDQPNALQRWPLDCSICVHRCALSHIGESALVSAWFLYEGLLNGLVVITSSLLALT